MNIGALGGIFGAYSVFFVTIFLTFSNASAIVDFKSVLIVAGGTAGIGFICFPAGKVLKIMSVFVRRLSGKGDQDYGFLVDEISNLSKAKKKGRKAYEDAIKEVKHLFLRDCAEALFWIESEISEEELRDLLETRAAVHYDEYMEEARIIKTIGKFPPALGLMGTTLGLIALLQSIGGSDGTSNLGPSMAVALVTTLYGLFFSNFVFVPISENLEQKTREDNTSRRMVVEGVLLVQKNAPTKYVEEKVKSFLLPGQRQKIGAAKGGKKG